MCVDFTELEFSSALTIKLLRTLLVRSRENSNFRYFEKSELSQFGASLSARLGYTIVRVSNQEIGTDSIVYLFLYKT